MEHNIRQVGKQSSEPLIRMCGVVKVYKTAAGELEALKGIDVDIFPGEFLGIMGKSGAGKTTLVNMLSGLDRLSGGEIWVGDVPVHKLSEDQAAAWRARYLGIVYQSFQLMPTLSVLKNITLAMDFGGLYRGRRSELQATELLKQVELEEHIHKLPSGVSGGQQQRVAIARALANDPPIIVADEPTGRLDTVTAETIFQIFERLVEEGKTVVMVTHDKSYKHRFSRVLEMADGEFVSQLGLQTVAGDVL